MECMILLVIVSRQAKQNSRARKAARCLENLLAVTGDGAACPVTSSPYTVEEEAGARTLFCPDHVEEYGSRPRMRGAAAGWSFVQDLPPETLPPDGSITLPSEQVMSLKEGRLILMEEPGWFVLVLGTAVGGALGLIALVALTFWISAALMLLQNIVLKVVRPRSTRTFLPLRMIGINTVQILIFGAAALFCLRAAWCSWETSLSAIGTTSRTLVLGAPISEEISPGAALLAVPVRERDAAVIVRPAPGGGRTCTTLRTPPEDAFRVAGIIDGALRSGALGGEPYRGRATFPLVPFLLLIAGLFLVVRNAILGAGYLSFRKDWKRLARGAVSWRRAKGMVADDREEWRLYTKKNDSFFLFPIELFPIPALLMDGRGREAHVLRGFLHPEFFSWKEGILHVPLRNLDAVKTTLSPVREFGALSLPPTDWLRVRIAGVTLALPGVGRSHIHSHVLDMPFQLNIGTSNADFSVTLPHKSWPLYEEVLAAYASPSTEAEVSTTERASIYFGLADPLALFTAEPPNLHAIVLLKKGDEGENEGHVQLYSPDGEIVLHVEVGRCRAEGFLRRTVLQVLGGIRGPDDPRDLEGHTKQDLVRDFRSAYAALGRPRTVRRRR
ncbi:MAG: hypothetical protein ACYTAF_11460 [Planctomycetota bacterium]|jgi:hypothetical protein